MNSSDTPHTTTAQIIGAWRLVRVEETEAGKPVTDKFYQANSGGIIIYDASGYMSVQISAPSSDRKIFPIPVRRVDAPPPTPEQQSDWAGAFITYYSYYGSWSYDEGSAVLTHNLESSLIPWETGVSYTQMATVEGDTLVFTNISHPGKPNETIARKIWERHVKY